MKKNILKYSIPVINIRIIPYTVGSKVIPEAKIVKSYKKCCIDIKKYNEHLDQSTGEVITINCQEKKKSNRCFIKRIKSKGSLSSHATMLLKRQTFRRKDNHSEVSSWVPPASHDFMHLELLHKVQHNFYIWGWEG